MRRKSVTYYQQAMQLKAIRSFDEDVAWCNFSSLQQTLRRLSKAFDNFFRRVKNGAEEAGYPKYKGRKFFRSVAYVYDDGIRLKNDRLHIQNVGDVRIFQHRPLPDGAKPKMVAVMRDKGWCWYAVFQIEIPESEPLALGRPSVGIDMGTKSFAALSTGELIDNPRWFRQAEERLATLQRRRARCKQRSRKYKELNKQIARLHAKTAER